MRLGTGILAQVANKDEEVQAPAGCCWVMQCSVPRPRTRSRQAMPTTSRPGNRPASVVGAARSLGALKVGTNTSLLAMDKLAYLAGRRRVSELVGAGMGRELVCEGPGLAS